MVAWYLLYSRYLNNHHAWYLFYFHGICRLIMTNNVWCTTWSVTIYSGFGKQKIMVDLNDQLINSSRHKIEWADFCIISIHTFLHIRIGHFKSQQKVCSRNKNCERVRTCSYLNRTRILAEINYREFRIVEISIIDRIQTYMQFFEWELYEKYLWNQLEIFYSTQKSFSNLFLILKNYTLVFKQC